MDQNLVLVTFVGAACALLLVRSVASPMRHVLRGWIIVAAAILVVIAIAYTTIPDYSGLIAVILWLLFILIPSLGSQWANRLLFQQKYERAKNVATAVAILHPFDDWPITPQIIHGIALTQQGKMSEAIEVFKRYEQHPSSIASTARLYLYRLQHRWHDLVTSLEQSNDLAVNPNAIANYVRALGEVGDLNRMMKAYKQHQRILTSTRLVSGVSLLLFGFCGRREQVERLFKGALRLYPQDLQTYWLGVADLAAGHTEQGNAELQKILNSADHNIRALGRYRLAHAVPVAETLLTPQSKQILNVLEREAVHEERYGRTAFRHRILPIATYTLLVANIVVFVMEMLQGGTTNVRTLFEMGAMVAPMVTRQGEWWRMITALFLHFGLLHIAGNMLALLVLGPFVERMLGFWRYLILYFVAGLGSMLVVLILMENDLIEVGILVGASGAIMGILGATAAILIRGWRVEKAVAARQRLTTILVILALQIFIDVAVIPQSSLHAHLSGAIIGFVTAAILQQFIPAEKSVATQAG